MTQRFAIQGKDVEQVQLRRLARENLLLLSLQLSFNGLEGQEPAFVVDVDNLTVNDEAVFALL
jgi:hypothetical protein